MTLSNASVSNSIQADAPLITGWRHELHTMPELCYQEVKTSAFIKATLETLGVDEIHTGLGKTGVVAIIRGKDAGERAIGLRADFDGLPITEVTPHPYQSQHAGRMHACGHDGHTAMLLGAAKHLAETRNFKGTAVLIFQPAEEGGAGAAAMMRDGLFDQFPVDEVYGMHNLPGLPLGQFAIRPGGIMASPDGFDITIKGRGGHAALPHQSADPIYIASLIIQAVQGLISRETDPLGQAVLSVTQIHAGNTHNVIPDSAEIGGTIRTLSPETRDVLERRLGEVARGVAGAYGLEADVRYERTYPVTVNHAAETTLAADCAAALVGEGSVDRNCEPLMGGEDFSFMLEEKPGAYIFLGNGDSAGLHHPEYNFNDAAIPLGVAYWTQLVENRLA